MYDDLPEDAVGARDGHYDGEGLYIIHLVNFKEIPLVTPLCSKSKFVGLDNVTFSCATGVKLWTVLQKIEH